MSGFSMARGAHSHGAPALAVAGMVFAAGLIHLYLAPEHLEEATYLGVLFAADFVGSAAAAFGILRGRRWGWVLGALVATGALVAYLVDGTFGLPGTEAGGLGSLLEPAGILAKTLEGLFLVACAFELVAGFGRRTLAVGMAAVVAAAGLATALNQLGAAPTEHHGGGEPAPSEQHHAAHPHSGKATLELRPEGASGVSGSASFEDGSAGVVVELDVRGLPKPDTLYLARSHPGTCATEGEAAEDGGGAHGEEGHANQHGGAPGTGTVAAR